MFGYNWRKDLEIENYVLLQQLIFLFKRVRCLTEMSLTVKKLPM